jgi:hypothetical protein
VEGAVERRLRTSNCSWKEETTSPEESLFILNSPGGIAISELE